MYSNYCNILLYTVTKRYRGNIYKQNIPEILRTNCIFSRVISRISPFRDTELATPNLFYWQGTFPFQWKLHKILQNWWSTAIPFSIFRPMIKIFCLETEKYMSGVSRPPWLFTTLTDVSCSWLKLYGITRCRIRYIEQQLLGKGRDRGVDVNKRSVTTHSYSLP